MRVEEVAEAVLGCDLRDLGEAAELADSRPRARLVLLLDEAQSMLDLRQAELELLVLAPGDEADLAEDR